MLLWQNAHTTAGHTLTHVRVTERTRHGRRTREEKWRVREIGNRRVRERKQGHMRTRLIEMFQYSDEYMVLKCSKEISTITISFWNTESTIGQRQKFATGVANILIIQTTIQYSNLQRAIPVWFYFLINKGWNLVQLGEVSCHAQIFIIINP